MDIILTILAVVFIGLMLTTALTFGLALLGFFIAIAFVTTFLIIMREGWRRWRFIKTAEPNDRKPSVIEGQYRDISNSEKKESL